MWYGCKHAVIAMRQASTGSSRGERGRADGQNKADPEKGLSVGGSVINVASFVAKMGAATPQLACEFTIPTPSSISSISSKDVHCLGWRVQ